MCFLESTQTCMYLSTDLPQTVSHLSLSSLSMCPVSGCHLSRRFCPSELGPCDWWCHTPNACCPELSGTPTLPHTRQTEVKGHSNGAQGHMSRKHPVRPYGKPDVIESCLLYLWLTHQNIWSTAEPLITHHHAALESGSHNPSGRPLVPRFKTTDAAHHLWLRSLTSGLKNCNWKTSNISVCLLQFLALCDLKSWPL